MDLRPYQLSVIADIQQAWDSGAQNVLVQLATGSGKTVVFSDLIAHAGVPCVAIAHRVELVSQISLSLARNGVWHSIIAPRSAIREIVNIHMLEIGRSYYDPRGRVAVAGVDTLVRMPPDTPWFKTIGLVVQDEGHHLLRENKWGTAAGLFPNARGLYPTATPCRADGKGLGRHADGLIDKMVVGVGMRELIAQGYLTDYRIFAPPSDIDLATVPLSASGDYSPPKLRTAVHKSHITGDVVQHYLRIAPGKLGVTFAVDIEAAMEIAEAFRAAGVPSEVITGKTSDTLRISIMRRFRAREILQLVNVDLLGEGVDVPAIEVVSMARPTQSFSLYSQQFGRSLRPLAGKTSAIVIDHVGNVMRHGLPDAPRVWSLDRRDRRRSAPSDAVPMRTCLAAGCYSVYPRTARVCPMCGHFTPPTARSAPEHVEGDLFELDAPVLAALRGEIARIDSAPRIPQGVDGVAKLSIIKRHRERQEAQAVLRDSIAQYAGYLHVRGLSDSEIYRKFWFTFGIDVATAQTLGTARAEELKLNIDEATKGL